MDFRFLITTCGFCLFLCGDLEMFGLENERRVYRRYNLSETTLQQGILWYMVHNCLQQLSNLQSFLINHLLILLSDVLPSSWFIICDTSLLFFIQNVYSGSTWGLQNQVSFFENFSYILILKFKIFVETFRPVNKIYYSDNQKTVEQEDDIIAILNCI